MLNRTAIRRGPVTMLAVVAALGIVRAQQPQIATQQQTTTQQPAPPLGAVSGVVVDSVTQKPLGGAVVSMVGTPTNPPAQPPGAPPVSLAPLTRQFRQMTDERGRFIFSDAPGGYRYTVSATKFGYFDGAYGRRGLGGAGTPPARGIVLADGQWFRDAKIELLPPASIAGRVFDEAGQPVVGGIVRADVEIYVSGTRQVASAVSATTDDRGMYRLAGLVAGSYVVSVPSAQHSVPAASFQVEPGSTAELPPAIAVDTANRLVMLPMAPPPPSAGGRSQVYPTMFYPNSRTLAEAVAVAIKPAEDRTGVDIQLNPVPSVRISGRLDGPADVIGNLSLRLMAAGTEGFGRGGESATALTTGDGAFTFLNVPSGSYTIVATRSIAEYTQRTPFAQFISVPLPPGARFTSSSSSAVTTAPVGTMLSTNTIQGNVRYQGRAAITVAGRDLVNIVVPMTAGITISGRFVFEGQGASSTFGVSPLGFGMTAEPANGDPSLGVAREQRRPGPPGPVPSNTPPPETFSVEGVMAGEFLLRAATGGVLKSIVWNGRDYTYSPFDTTGGRDITDVVVTFTDQVASAVTGTVRDLTGQPASGAAVIVFPAERAQWMKYGVQPTRLRAAAAATTGVFTVRPLPAGDYFIIAIDGDAIEQWKDPKWLERASALATKFSMTWGGRVTQDLVVAQVR